MKCCYSRPVVGVQIPPDFGGLPCGSDLLLEPSLIVQFANCLLRAVSLPHIVKTFVHQDIHASDSTSPPRPAAYSSPHSSQIPQCYFHSSRQQAKYAISNPSANSVSFTFKMQPETTTFPPQIIHPTLISHLTHGDRYQLSFPLLLYLPPPLLPPWQHNLFSV